MKIKLKSGSYVEILDHSGNSIVKVNENGSIDGACRYFEFGGDGGDLSDEELEEYIATLHKGDVGITNSGDGVFAVVISSYVNGDYKEFAMSVVNTEGGFMNTYYYSYEDGEWTCEKYGVGKLTRLYRHSFAGTLVSDGVTYTVNCTVISNSGEAFEANDETLFYNAVNIKEFDLTANGHTLVVIGDWTKANDTLVCYDNSDSSIVQVYIGNGLTTVSSDTVEEL